MEFFKLSTPQCLSAISVFDAKPSSSELQCASSCLDNIVDDIRQIVGFLPVVRFPPPIKLIATIYLNYR